MTLKHGDVEMKTLTLEVATLKDVKRRARDAFKGRKQGARISFATPERLFNLMTAKRWELIRMMTGAGPLTIRGAARRVDRDVKGVHGDVHALLIVCSDIEIVVDERCKRLHHRHDLANRANAIFD